MFCKMDVFSSTGANDNRLMKVSMEAKADMSSSSLIFLGSPGQVNPEPKFYN